MTELMLRNINLVKEDKDVPIDNQCLVDWMDDKVDALEMIRQIVNATDHDCYMGHLNPSLGEYEMQIESCAWKSMAEKKCHIYQGVRHLANAVGQELTVEPFIEDQNEVGYFVYRGVKFFELRNIGEEFR